MSDTIIIKLILIIIFETAVIFFYRKYFTYFITLSKYYGIKNHMTEFRIFFEEFLTCVYNVKL